jgi:hypothetical protein
MSLGQVDSYDNPTTDAVKAGQARAFGGYVLGKFSVPRKHYGGVDVWHKAYVEILKKLRRRRLPAQPECGC